MGTLVWATGPKCSTNTNRIPKEYPKTSQKATITKRYFSQCQPKQRRKDASQNNLNERIPQRNYEQKPAPTTARNTRLGASPKCNTGKPIISHTLSKPLYSKSKTWHPKTRLLAQFGSPECLATFLLVDTSKICVGKTEYPTAKSHSSTR